MSKDESTWDRPAAGKGGSSADATGPGRYASRPSAQALPLVELDRYDIGGEYDHGAIGRILRARDRRLNRPVAIKELMVRDGDAEARFVTEAFITARLQHPSIVPVYEAGRWSTGEPFYAMKFVSGRSLADVISETKTLQERLALLPHVLAVAEAIAYAHSERIIHRDLKPANILVGAFGETVVIDWGLAKDLAREVDEEISGVSSVSSSGADASLTHQGMVVGTPAYMPPEQATGLPVDERADVYALGAILYHLLSGMKPYDTGSSTQVLSQVLRSPPVPLRQRQKGIPADLLAIVDKAMARTPSQRYANARELAEDLRRFQTGQIVGAHAYSVGERLWRFVRRQKAAVAVTAVALLALLGVGTVSFLRIMAERDRAERKQAEAELAQRDAEAARQDALKRADELILLHARIALDRDPNEAITWLLSLSPGFTRWQAVRTIAADARARSFATVLSGHAQTVDDLLFTRDGKRVISCSDDYTIRIWNVESGDAELLTGHTDEVWRIALSQDGRLLASASKDRTARLWNLETGERRVLSGHAGPVDSVAFTPDGRQLVSSNRGDDLLRVWDVGTGALVRTFKTGMGPLGLLRLSADGRHALVQARELPRAQLWDLTQGTSHTLEHQAKVEAIAFSPKGDLAATGGLDQTVRLWDPRTGKGRLLGEQLGAIYILTFSPDGGQLAAGNAEGQLRLWNLRTGRSELLGSQNGRINDAVFSRDGRLLATSSDDRTVLLWDLNTNHSRVLRGPKGAAHPLDFSPDGRWLAVGSYDTTVRLYGVTAEAHRVLATSPAPLTTQVASASGSHLATVGSDGMLRLIDVATGTPTPLENLGGPEPRALQFSRDGRWLATGGKDGRARLWDVATRKLARQLEGHTAAITALTFPRDGQRLATADATGEVRVWELESGQSRSLGRHDQEVVLLAFAPDGQRLASGTRKGELRLWNVAEGSFRSPRGHEAEVRSLFFSPDGQRLVSGGMDHTLRIWDMASDKYYWANTSGNGVLKVVMSSDGELIVTASWKDSTLRLWDGRTGVSRGVLQGHQGDITDLALSPDGRRLASTSTDLTVRLWDLTTQESRVLRGHTAKVAGVLFLNDQNLASIGWDGTVRLWPDDLPSDPEALRAWMATIVEHGQSTP
jgi:WD40 repeat protein